jgi:hypothetical protein
MGRNQLPIATPRATSAIAIEAIASDRDGRAMDGAGQGEGAGDGGGGGRFDTRGAYLSREIEKLSLSLDINAIVKDQQSKIISVQKIWLRAGIDERPRDDYL